MDRARAETQVLLTHKPLLRTSSRGPGFLALSYWSGSSVRHALVSVDNDSRASLGGQTFPSVQALALHFGAVPPPPDSAAPS